MLNTSAYLSVDKNRAMAETTAGSTDRVTLLTTVTFKYTNSNNQVSTVSTKGAGYAYAGNQDGKGISGSSQHSVQGGTTWGNWSCNLSTNI